MPYADLSDFFFVWLKRALPNHPLVNDPFNPDNQLTPKAEELCEMAHWDSDRYPHKDKQFFEDGMAVAFTEGRRILREDGVVSVVFAHKTTEGWEALLSGMIRGGWTFTGSWPIATEMGSRLRARDSAALATSIHLICRPRPDDASVGDWADVAAGAPSARGRMDGTATDRGCSRSGPGLRLRRSGRWRSTAATPPWRPAEGHEVALPEYLERVWEVVGREALRQVLGTAEAQARNGLAAALGRGCSPDRAVPLDAAKHGIIRRERQEGAEEWGSRGHSGGQGFQSPLRRGPALRPSRWAPTWTTGLRAIIETRKGVVRLLPVTARSRQLFGESGAGGLADEIESSAASAPQLSLFPAEPPGTRSRVRRQARAASVAGEESGATLAATTLDRVHIAMLFQASGRTEALRNLLEAEQDRGPDFLRLANALSALYPRVSQEKRLLDAMLLAAPR